MSIMNSIACILRSTIYDHHPKYTRCIWYNMILEVRFSCCKLLRTFTTNQTWQVRDDVAGATGINTYCLTPTAWLARLTHGNAESIYHTAYPPPPNTHVIPTVPGLTYPRNRQQYRTPVEETLICCCRVYSKWISRLAFAGNSEILRVVSFCIWGSFWKPVKVTRSKLAVLIKEKRCLSPKNERLAWLLLLYTRRRSIVSSTRDTDAHVIPHAT